MAKGGWRSSGAALAVGVQVGLAPGAVLWMVVVLLGLSDDRRVGWVCFGLGAANGAVAALWLRRRWESGWMPPAAVAALGLSAAFAVTWTFGAIGEARADGSPGPSFSAWLLAMAASLLAATPTVLLLRWRGGPLRWVCWLLGLSACVVSIPYLVWLVGIPVLSWGRAVMLHSGLHPLARLRAGGRDPRVAAPAPSEPPWP